MAPQLTCPPLAVLPYMPLAPSPRRKPQNPIGTPATKFMNVRFFECSSRICFDFHLSTPQAALGTLDPHELGT